MIGNIGSEITVSPDRLQRMMMLFCCLAVITGALEAWFWRDAINADGVSYLEVGEAFLEGDWKRAINGYWSPFYSILLGVALYVFRPAPHWEYPTAHLVNFFVHLLSLGCFTFFLSEFIKYQRRVKVLFEGYTSIPDWAWLIIGYGLFIWTSLDIISLSRVTPDGCVAAFVYLAAGLLIRIKQKDKASNRNLFGYLGLVLALAYLAKAAMFPLAFIFLAASAASVGNLRKKLFSLTIALVAFLLLAGPFIVVLSIIKARMTFGDAGKLNYAWYVAFTQYRHWQGHNPTEGVPRHTTRKIFDEPPIYEFGTPIRATYPPWYDPSYWFEGLETQFDFRKQLQRLKESIAIYADIFVNKQSGLIAAVGILYWMSWQRCNKINIIASQWELIFVAGGALAMYSLIYVEPRFIAPFILLFWLGLFSAVNLPESSEARKLVTGVLVVISVLLLSKSIVSSIGSAYRIFRDPMHSESSTAVETFEIAYGLGQMGMKPGDKIAIIGWGSSGDGAYWARMARLRIVAEITQGGGVRDGDKFWRANEDTKSRALQALASTGAKIVVAPVPESISPSGWQRIGSTKYYAYFLERSPIRHQQGLL